MDRRRFLATLGAAAVVVGFDPLGRRWVSAHEAADCDHSFDGVPPLEGTLSLDRAARAGASTDMGNIVHTVPAAVLRPASAADIAAMIGFCRRHRIDVATRGQHHSMHGQGLTCGLIVESGSLAQIRSIAADHVVVDAGATWKQVLEATLPHGLKPPLLTGFVGISVGGTLSVGGAPMHGRRGGLGEQVRALQVVTGAGDIVDCSPTAEPDLFEAMFGGLGQCGVITQATVDLVPAKQMARTFLLHYTDITPFLSDFRTLFDRGECDEVYNVCFPPLSDRFVWQLWATVFYDPGDEPDGAHLLRGLHHPAALAVTQDKPYFDYATFVDQQVAVLSATVQWERLVKPWYDVWLSDAAVETHLRDVLAEITQEDLGSGGFVLLFAIDRSKVTRPFYRVPDARGGDRAWLFDLATTSRLPGPDRAFAARMGRRNRRWFDRARALGGVRYPIGQLDFTQPDWAHHYGEMWPEFERRKRLYDPDMIMTPGPGIF